VENEEVGSVREDDGAVGVESALLAVVAESSGEGVVTASAGDEVGDCTASVAD
jgi:hypothetical protein